MPKIYIISGCNGSGKTTASYGVLPELLECCEYINSDEFAKSLSPFSPETAAIKASRYMLMKFDYLKARRKDFGIETTLSTRSLLKMAERAQEDGYEVTVVYFWLRSPEMAVERIRARVMAGGHNIPEETVRRRYYTGLKYFFEDYTKVCDKWMLVDNSDYNYEIVATGRRDGSIEILDKELYETIRELSGKAEDIEK